eukprot:8136074-Alexandrium_andersonii.AAC.1
MLRRTPLRRRRAPFMRPLRFSSDLGLRIHSTWLGSRIRAECSGEVFPARGAPAAEASLSLGPRLRTQ